MNDRLRVSELDKRYGDTIALRAVSFTVAAGEAAAVVGPNGCGKTTLLEVIEGLRRPDRGSVSIDGVEYEWGHSRDGAVGAQLQEESLPARIKVKEALRFYALAAGKEFPTSLVEMLDMEDFLDSRFASLSGGQKRRTVLALAALGDSPIVLLDEPTASLDPLGVDLVNALVQGLAASGKAVLIASHDLDQVSRTCSSAHFLHKGQLIRQGTISELIRTAGPPMVIEVAGAELGEEDIQVLGIERSAMVGSTVRYFGSNDLPDRVRSWSGYDRLAADGSKGFRIRPTSLHDAYILSLPDQELAEHNASIAAWEVD